MFEKFALVAQKIEEGDGGTWEEELQGAVDVYATYERLLDLIAARVDLPFVQKYYPEASGYHDGISFDVEDPSDPKLVVKFEDNTACNCHPEYQTIGYAIPVSILLKGDAGIIEFRAQQQAKKDAEEVRKKAEKEAKDARRAEERRQTDLKKLAELKEQYPND